METSHFSALISSAVENANLILDDVFQNPDESEAHLRGIVGDGGKTLKLLLGEDSEKIKLSDRKSDALITWFSRLVETTANSARAQTEENVDRFLEIHRSRLELMDEVIESIFATNEAAAALSSETGNSKLVLDLADAVVARDDLAIAGKSYEATQQQIGALLGTIQEKCSFSALF